MKVAGFGYRQGARVGSLADALDSAVKAYGNVDCLAAGSGKAEGVDALGLERNLPVNLVEQAVLPAIETWTQSEASLRAKGTGSFAEAVAMAAAGPGSRLLGPRIVSEDRMATCAVAEGDGVPLL